MTRRFILAGCVALIAFCLVGMISYGVNPLIGMVSLAAGVINLANALREGKQAP